MHPDPEAPACEDAMKGEPDDVSFNNQYQQSICEPSKQPQEKGRGGGGGGASHVFIGLTQGQ